MSKDSKVEIEDWIGLTVATKNKIDVLLYTDPVPVIVHRGKCFEV